MTTLEDRPEILTLIQKVSQENGFENAEIAKVTRNDKGEGYIGEVFMIKLMNGNDELDLVIKAAFIDENIRDTIPIKKAFENEIFFYKNILPEFQQLQPTLDYIPKCFKVCVENQQEALILENLKSQNFETYDKKKCLDDDHIRLIFETYGKFHGVSYVFKAQKPEQYSETVKNMTNMWNEFAKNEDLFDKLVIENGKVVEELLIPGQDDILIEKYKKYTGSNLIKIFHQLIDDEIDYPCIVHGDCWSNNMLFKYQKTATGRKPSEIRLIDFQLVYSGTPVFDLSYCLYSGGSKKVFDNLNEHLETYYKSFSKCVKELGSDPDKLYSFSKFKEHWRKYSIFGMVMAINIWRLKLVNKSDSFDLMDATETDMTELFTNVKFDKDEYARIIKELLWHLSDIGAL